jgi:FKBP12-rapamycin complex-associated protein
MLIFLFFFGATQQHHTTVIQAVMLIFKSLGLKCIPFLPQIMPPFLQCMRTKETGFLKFLFKQLGLLVAIVKQHIRVRTRTHARTH